MATRHRGADDHDRDAAASRSETVEARVRIGIADLDVGGLHRQLLGERLGEHRLGTVAPEGRGELRENLAGRIDPHHQSLRRARQRETRGGIRIQRPPFCRTVDTALLAGRHSYADQAALRAGLCLQGTPLGYLPECERLVQDLRITAAVVHVAGRNDVRKLVRLNEIAAPQFDAIHAQLIRRRIDQPLDDEVGNLGAEPAVGTLLALVGQRGDQRHLNTADPIGPGDLRHSVAVRAVAVLQVRAVVICHREAQREQRAIA